MTCEECKAARAPETVPYIVYESTQDRMERREKRFVAVIVLLIVLLVGTNCAWIHYESQFEAVSIESEQQADNGTNYFAGGDLFGTAESQSDETRP